MILTCFLIDPIIQRKTSPTKNNFYPVREMQFPIASTCCLIVLVNPFKDFLVKRQIPNIYAWQKDANTMHSKLCKGLPEMS